MEWNPATYDRCNWVFLSVSKLHSMEKFHGFFSLDKSCVITFTILGFKTFVRLSRWVVAYVVNVQYVVLIQKIWNAALKIRRQLDSLKIEHALYIQGVVDEQSYSGMHQMWSNSFYDEKRKYMSFQLE